MSLNEVILEILLLLKNSVEDLTGVQVKTVAVATDQNQIFLQQ